MHFILLAALLIAPSAEAETNPIALPETGPVSLPAVAQEEEEPVMNVWTGAVSLGAGWTGGNSKTEGASVNIDAKYRRPKDRTNVKIFYDYQSSNSVKLKDLYYADLKYDHFMNDKTYLWGQVRAEVNTVARLKLRQIYGAGLGHQFADSDTWKFSGEAGISFVDEEFRGNVTNDYTAARLAYDADWIPNERWSISQSTDFYPSLEDSDVWYVVADTNATVNLTESMIGKLAYIFQHVETPAPGVKQDDHTVQLTVGWSF